MVFNSSSSLSNFDSKSFMSFGRGVGMGPTESGVGISAFFSSRAKYPKQGPGGAGATLDDAEVLTKLPLHFVATLNL